MPRPRLPLLALALLAAAPAAAQTPAPHGHAAASADPTMGVHGMLVFGDSAVYLSHLPLYRAPHDWQVILRATMASDAATSVPDALAAYRADRAASGERVYTLEPERFPLSHLTELEPGETFRFTGTLYRGHFERGGTPIVTGAVFEASAVHLRQVVNVPPPPGVTMEETWVLFGTPGDAYLAHHVEGAPDFDQIAALEPVSASSDDDGQGTAVVRLLPGVRGRPVEEGETLGVREVDAPPDRLRGRYRVARVVYLEFDDLARP